MPDIKQLPQGVINKIAAGEVIERPASVVKELMENAVDAGSTRIDVSVEQGGAQLIRVADNGCGVTPEQLPLMVASHATSKIRSADDLFSVDTLGFRGEALASISEVSEFHIRSRAAELDAGAELEVIGGKLGDASPIGCPVGTTIEVRNLFYNTPVRRKFLRTTQTEMGHAVEAFTRVALAQTNTHFCIRHNDRILHDLPPVDRWTERIETLFGADIGQNLIWVEAETDGLRLHGYVVDPQISRSNNRMQYLFLNGRHIRDRALQHALTEGYRGLLMTGRHPACFLQLEVDPKTVDVNVHPTKVEVRFQDSGRIYSQLLSSVRGRFLSADLTATVTEAASAISTPLQEVASDSRRQWSDWAERQAAGGGESTQGSLGLQYSPTSEAITMESIGSRWREGGRPGGDERPASSFPSPHFTPGSDAVGAAAAAGPAAYGPMAKAATSEGRKAIQLHDRYLVVESEEGMLVIDQHALHERVLYEQIRPKVLAGRLESQRLLTPEPVALTASEAAAVLDAQETLAQLGLNVEPFGGETVLVSSYPVMLARIGPAELLRQVVELLLAGGKGPQKRDLLDDLLNMFSCKAAIKAGDHLAPEEIEALLEHRDVCQDAHHCPHGRPTALVFTREELDKRFKRT